MRTVLSIILSIFMVAALSACGGGGGGAAPAKPPVSVDVFIAFDQSVTNLAALQFQLISTAGATFSNSDPQPMNTMNAALGSYFAGNFTAANSNTIVLMNATGFNTGTTPFLKVTYAIAAGSDLPTFTVATAGFTAANPDLNATVPPVTAANLVVTTVFHSE